MTLHLGYVPSGSTLYIPFNTFDSNGASITLTGLATSDILIYKNGSVTQRSSTAGFTLLDTDGIDFDGLTGIHGFSIDLADNTDAGFYAAGSTYWVVISSVTVDTRTVNFVAATFFIGPVAANATQILGTAISTPATAGVLDVNLKNIANATVSASTAQLGVNVVNWKGQAAATVDTNGYPVVTVKDGTGAGEINTNGGKVVGVELVDVLTTYTGNTVQTGDSFARIGVAGAGLTNIDLPNQTMDITGNITGNLSGSVGSVSGAVGSVTGNVGGNVTGTVGGFATAAKAEIESEVNDALVVHRLDELLNADSDIDGAAPPTVGSVFHELMTKTAGSFTYDQTTDSNEALRDRGDAAWITATGFSTHSAADVWAAATRTLTSISDSAGVTTLLTRITAALEVYTAAHIRSATGLASANLDTQLDALPTNAELATALAAADDAVLAAVAALNNLSQANIRTAVGLGSANLDTQLDALPTNAELATALGTADDAVLAAIAALNNLSQANIRSAVGLGSANLDTQLDALPTAAEVAVAAFTTAMTEAYRGTGATATLAQAVYEILAHLGESSISGTTKTLKKLDGSTTAKTYTLNSATTPTAITETT